MSQKSITTTTSFTVSSNESLNKLPSSSSHSNDSGDNMTTDSVHSSQYSGVTSNPINNNMLINRRQKGKLPSSQSLLPPPPPPPPQESFYDTLDALNINSLPKNAQHPPPFDSHHQLNNSSVNQFENGCPESDSIAYGTYNNRNSLQPSSNMINVHQPSFPVSNEQMLSPISVHQSSSNNLSELYQHHQKQSPTNQRSSTSSLESPSSTPLMPINVKGMLLHGLPSDEVLRNWLTSIRCEEYLKNFSEHGYDMHLITRMTPQDLAAIGCPPTLRKKLLLEIKKLNLDDDIPETKPASLEKWLEMLKLDQYYSILISEGYDTVDKVCKLTWEDFEEIGIYKLGHLKKLVLGIAKVQKLTKQEQKRQNDTAIYDVHPNHRVSLNGGTSESRLGTLGRVRSGFFQTRSGANLDHRGLPVAKVMPALKHVNSSIVNSDPNQQINITHSTNECVKTNNTHLNTNGYKSNNRLSTSDRKIQPVYDIYKSSNNNSNQEETFKMSELATTLRRNPPPLPPVRTNSLKSPLGANDHVGGFCGQPIYGHNNYGISSTQNGTIYAPQATNSTSFLRTPKLGTLTATTNKMLTVGGHIQTISQTTTMRPIMPIREAPLPPGQMQQQSAPTIHEQIEDELVATISSNSSTQPNNFSAVSGGEATTNNTTLLGSSLIGHQLASADEFPPPPPCQ